LTPATLIGGIPKIELWKRVATDLTHADVADPGIA
jgi:hypothetical protein